ncbi:MAG TPA: BlaI/MecI/CopY family transcriptional regulator [Candidatus Angelobacter sp.]|jgi:predicted transcriptional regulator|nr:BlaI/MecI/CopY family transcriptional regulator [Candidatus Angelobacter sp.]
MWPKRQNEDSRYSVDQLGSLESELMQRIWTRGEISVRDLHSEVAGRLAYTTIMTTLDRLYKKGLLDRRKVGRAYYYAPRFTQEEYQGRLTAHFMGMVLHEGKPSNAVLSCFVDVVTEADRAMLDKLEQLVKAKRRALRRSE